MNSEQIISSQILLRSKTGAAPDSQTRITAANLEEWTPSAEAQETIRARLRAYGFDVGPIVGNGLAITGSARLFETVFKVTLEQTPTHGIQFKEGARSVYELPTNNIPGELRKFVAAVTFTPPPNFGPGKFSG